MRHNGDMTVSWPSLLMLALIGAATASRIKPQGWQRNAKALSHGQQVDPMRIFAQLSDAAAHDPGPASLVQATSMQGAVDTQFQVARKVSRNTLMVGIGAFLVIVLGCSCFLLNKCCLPDIAKQDGHDKYKHKQSVKSSGASSAASSTISTGERQQHTHNGRLIYEWEQNDMHGHLFIQVPGGLTKNDLEIKITASCVQVGCKDKPPFLNEETYAAVSETESAWRLRSNGELQIQLKKERKAEWPCVLRPTVALAA